MKRKSSSLISTKYISIFAPTTTFTKMSMLRGHFSRKRNKVWKELLFEGPLSKNQPDIITLQ
jgi:hypothetical protein